MLGVGLLRRVPRGVAQLSVSDRRIVCVLCVFGLFQNCSFQLAAPVQSLLHEYTGGSRPMPESTGLSVYSQNTAS